jgi:GTP-binding protein LepA
MEEPWIKVTILLPDEYLGAVLKLCEDGAGARSTSPMQAAARW